MKNFAKLTLFFSLCFVIFFLTGILLRLLSSWVDVARFIPLDARPGEDVTETAWKALPAAFYLSILLTLSYSARRKMPIPLSIFGIFILGCVFFLGVSMGITRSEAMKLALKPVTPIQGGPGLILSRQDNAVILLRGSADAQGPRVVSIPGRPLIYQNLPVGPNNTILSLPVLTFTDSTPWFVRSLTIDFTLCAEELKGRLKDGYIPFAAYAFSLVLLLVSLRFLLELSQWALANLFIGALVFRGILALETFLNAREINALVASFIGKRIPAMLVTPAVFGALGVLVIFYTLLARIVRPRRDEDD